MTTNQSPAPEGSNHVAALRDGVLPPGTPFRRDPLEQLKQVGLVPPSEPLPTEGERETCKQIYFPWDRGDTLIAVRQLRAFCAAQVQEATAAERERLLALLEARKCPFTHRSLDGGKTWPKYTLEEKLELLCFCVNDTDSHPDEPALRKALTELQQQLKERDEKIERMDKMLTREANYIREMDGVIDEAGVAVSCINPLEDLRRAVTALCVSRAKVMDDLFYAQNELKAAKVSLSASEALVKPLREGLKGFVKTGWHGGPDGPERFVAADCEATRLLALSAPDSTKGEQTR